MMMPIAQDDPLMGKVLQLNYIEHVGLIRSVSVVYLIKVTVLSALDSIDPGPVLPVPASLSRPAGIEIDSGCPTRFAGELLHSLARNGGRDQDGPPPG